MQINENLSREIYEDAGEARLSRAKHYIREGKINIYDTQYENKNNFKIKASVIGNYDDYEVTIKVENGELEEASCECQDYLTRYGVCKHIVATLLKFEQTKFWDSDEENISKGRKTKKYRRITRKQKSKNRT